MHTLFLAFLSILGLGLGASISQPARAAAGSDRVLVQPRKIVLLRNPKLQKNFPHKRRATITYPVVSGLRDPAISRRVRAILDFKNIFGYSLKDYREDTWLDEFDYKVNHNQNSLFDITFRQSGSGAYPDDHEKHFLIDLSTGRIVKASDAFEQSKFNSLVASIDSKLQLELRELASEVASAKDADPQDVESIKQAHESLRFEVSNLDDFSVGPRGITFLYDAGLPHVIQAFAPVGHYLFTWAELKPYIKPNGPLAQFVR